MSSGHQVPAGLNALTNHLSVGFRNGRPDGLSKAANCWLHRKEASHVNW